MLLYVFSIIFAGNNIYEMWHIICVGMVLTFYNKLSFRVIIVYSSFIIFVKFYYYYIMAVSDLLRIILYII